VGLSISSFVLLLPHTMGYGCDRTVEVWGRPETSIFAFFAPSREPLRGSSGEIHSREDATAAKDKVFGTFIILRKNPKRMVRPLRPLPPLPPPATRTTPRRRRTAPPPGHKTPTGNADPRGAVEERPVLRHAGGEKRRPRPPTRRRATARRKERRRAGAFHW